MPRRNAAADEVGDLRRAMAVIGRVIEDTGITPKGKQQQIAGILAMYGVRVQVSKPKGVVAAPVLPLEEGAL